MLKEVTFYYCSSLTVFYFKGLGQEGFKFYFYHKQNIQLMYSMLQHSHSGLRWIVLILLVVAIVNGLMKWQGGKTFTAGDKKIGLFAMTAVHIQFLLGLILYFISPKVIFDGASMKDPMLRFYLVEHISMMLLAVGLITVGYSRAKRAASDTSKFKTTFIFYLIGLILILAAIPWPPRFGAGWF